MFDKMLGQSLTNLSSDIENKAVGIIARVVEKRILNWTKNKVNFNSDVWNEGS